MAAYRWVDDLRSPAGWLPVHRDQLRAQRSVSSMGSLYLFTCSVQWIFYHHCAIVACCATCPWKWDWSKSGSFTRNANTDYDIILTTVVCGKFDSISSHSGIFIYKWSSTLQVQRSFTVVDYSTSGSHNRAVQVFNSNWGDLSSELGSLEVLPLS